MKITTQVAAAVILGVIAVLMTGHASHTTGSTVMIAEMAHSIADTVGLCLLLFALVLHAQKQEYPWIGQVSGTLLFLAGSVALGFGAGHLIALSGGMNIPIKNPMELFWVSSATFVVVFVQIKLTDEVHHLLHGHSHRNEKAAYFFGSKAPALTTSKMLHRTSGSARAELFADLIQAATGILMGIVALGFGDIANIRYVDSSLTLVLGAWMIWRGFSMMVDE